MNVTKNRTITKGKHIAVYSRGKMGKTTFLAEAVKDAADNGLMILTGEDGLSEHKNYRDIIPVLADENGDYRIFGESRKKAEWPKFLTALKDVYTEWAGPGKLIAIDSVDLIINGSATSIVSKQILKIRRSGVKKLVVMLLKLKENRLMSLEVLSYLNN